MDADVRPDHLEEPGDEVDLDVEVLHGADEVEHLLVRVVREGDDDSLDVEDLHHLRKLLEAAEDGDIRQAVPARLGLSVHESDEVEAVLRVLAELLRDELADVAGPDDDGVLHVGEVTSGESAGQRARGGDPDDGEEPESEQPLEAGIDPMRDRREGEEQPAAHRDQVEDPDEVVGGGVVGALLVEVVEAVELRDDHPGRQAQAEDEQLDLRGDGIGAPGLLEEERRGEEGEREPDEVGQHEHAAHEPASPHAQRARPPALEDLKSSRVHRRGDFDGILRVGHRLDRAHVGVAPPLGSKPWCRNLHSPDSSGRTPDARFSRTNGGLLRSYIRRLMPAMNEWTACSRRFRPKPELSTRLFGPGTDRRIPRPACGTLA